MEAAEAGIPQGVNSRTFAAPSSASSRPKRAEGRLQEFNLYGDALAARLRAFRRHGVHVLGSFIFGLPSDRESTFDATVKLAEEADLTFAQFVLLTPFPGTVDFDKWAAPRKEERVDGVSITQHWLIPEDRRPKLFTEHPTLSLEEIRVRTQGAWDQFYSWRRIWARSRRRVVEGAPGVRVVSKCTGRYANTGIATDSAPRGALGSSRALAGYGPPLVPGSPMPDLAMPGD
jgi:radical SAM superfamily enzyme YgiQ (UPF0313 family)